MERGSHIALYVGFVEQVEAYVGAVVERTPVVGVATEQCRSELLVVGVLGIACVDSVAQLEAPLRYTQVAQESHGRVPHHVAAVAVEREYQSALDAEGVKPSEVVAFHAEMRVEHEFVVNLQACSRSGYRVVEQLGVPSDVVSLVTEAAVADYLKYFALPYTLLGDPVAVEFGISMVVGVLDECSVKSGGVVAQRVIQEDVGQFAAQSLAGEGTEGSREVFLLVVVVKGEVLNGQSLCTEIFDHLHARHDGAGAELNAGFRSQLRTEECLRALIRAAHFAVVEEVVVVDVKHQARLVGNAVVACDILRLCVEQSGKAEE